MTLPPEHVRQDLAHRVLDRIKGEHLAPRARFYFILENYVFWGLGALAVLLGAIAFSAALFEVENAGWDLYPATHGDLVSFFFESAPFLWALVLAAFIAIGYANVRRTRQGYRYPLILIALGAVLAAVPLGSAFYAAGVGGVVEGALGDHPPFYRPILSKEREWWGAPERGLIGGTVESSTPGLSTFLLKDFNGNEWTIDASDLSPGGRITVARGGVVRVVGVAATSTAGDFHACFVFPWKAGPLSGRPPPPVALVASTSSTGGAGATNAAPARSEVCKGLRPYDELRIIDEDGL